MTLLRPLSCCFYIGNTAEKELIQSSLTFEWSFFFFEGPLCGFSAHLGGTTVPPWGLLYPGPAYFIIWWNFSLRRCPRWGLVPSYGRVGRRLDLQAGRKDVTGQPPTWSHFFQAFPAIPLLLHKGAVTAVWASKVTTYHRHPQVSLPRTDSILGAEVQAFERLPKVPWNHANRSRMDPQHPPQTLGVPGAQAWYWSILRWWGRGFESHLIPQST